VPEGAAGDAASEAESPAVAVTITTLFLTILRVEFDANAARILFSSQFLIILRSFLRRGNRGLGSGGTLLDDAATPLDNLLLGELRNGSGTSGLSHGGVHR